MLKSLLRPLARQGISLTEPMVGFWTDPTGFLPNRLRMLCGSYVEFLLNAMYAALPENGTFVDIGANVGFISRQIARKFDDIKIIAFEPNPRIYPLLKRNLDKYPNCTSFQMGLGKSEGELEFFHGEDSCVGSFVPHYAEQHAGNYLRGVISSENVRVTTGDIALSSVGTIDVVKLDVEGFENEVLAGMSSLFAARKIKTLFFEFRPFAQSCAHQRPEETISILNRAGYVVFEVEGARRGASVDATNMAVLMAELGERGYTTLRAGIRVWGLRLTDVETDGWSLPGGRSDASRETAPPSGLLARSPTSGP